MTKNRSKHFIDKHFMSKPFFNIHFIWWKSKKKVHRQVKDKVFRFIFEKDKEALLQLYNALNETSYEDASQLQVVTLESAVYIVMKNDLAFILAGTLNLYEHQSTYNPNMPVRFLLYLGQEYQRIVEEAQQSLYGRRQITLPAPKCIVFYNGEQEIPEEQIIRLSDAYRDYDGEADVEVKVRLLNINYGHNKKLMESCKSLNEYAQFVELSRQQAKKKGNTKEVMREVIDYCIKNDILADFLKKYRGEVLGMILEEFDVEKYERSMEEYGRDKMLVAAVEANMQNLQLDLETACKALNTTVEDYYEAKNNFDF